MRITELIRCDREYKSVVLALGEQLRAEKPLPLVVNGLQGGASDAFITEIVEDGRKLSGAPVLLFAENEDSAERIAALLSRASLSVRVFKSRDLVFHSISASHDTERERLSVLSEICGGTVDAIVTTPSAALLHTMPKDQLLASSVSLTVGDEISPDHLQERLSSLGFTAVDMVESAGQYARRGGILDVYADADQPPVRIEFFGDEIDRMESFDPETQRVSAPCPALNILPAAEVPVTAEARAAIVKALERLKKNAADPEIAARLESELAVAKSDLPIPFRDRFLGLIYETPATLFSYFEDTRRPLVCLIGTAAADENIKRFCAHLEDERTALLSLGLTTERGARFAGTRQDLDAFLTAAVPLHLNPFSGGVNGRLGGLFGFRSRRTVAYGDNGAMLREDLMTFRKSLYRTLIVCENKSGAQSLKESLASDDIAAIPLYEQEKFDYNSLQNAGIYITVDLLEEGFDLLMPKIAVLSMHKDLGRAVMANRRRQRILKKVGGAGQRLLSHADLAPGDYVVHANYGIGLFEGIQTVTAMGVTRDYITIRYAGTDKLFVPCDRLEMIGKYIGARDKDGKVKLSTMGGTDWSRTKARAKSAAKDIAKDLVELYARRQRTPGFAFPPDSEMEDEFASAFEYEPTACQMRAIEEIKADMQKAVPMNRLLCGDVGFGKTEVALRAAFKAILGGKQVAILVPTTILALQHYQTALSRMRGYPVQVEMLSRFCTPKQQEGILRRVKRGETDILIGTHKLLSKHLEFKDLGLLIIDEEQRFGVAQKEKLRKMAANVDTLTLTATPIPRTLNMAMNGIADMSILDEAPVDRHPVQTYVLEHDDVVIADAIRRELLRGGQILYLYNRVENIDLLAGKLMKDFPEARIAYAHGQMEREELEDIWQMLVRGEIDLLVCTTIIETGIDLPSANTLIIENADRMGLAQLHQIRGRVGRGCRQAYAYFTYRPGKVLSEIAEKRLSTIRAYAEFGAGFRIALRDLEIRGAGNLLGAEQHGYIDGVGYELYVRLLSEAVLEEQGKTPEPPFEATVDFPIGAHISDRYIASSATRMEMYKKISLIATEADRMDIIDEFTDRFGDPPKEVTALTKLALLRALAEKCRIRRTEQKDGRLIFSPEAPDLAAWSEVFEKIPGLMLRGAPTPTVSYRLAKGQKGEDEALKILLLYCEASQNEPQEGATPQ
jgi:transcription-repair coupling factor (superfamily II helicase)